MNSALTIPEYHEAGHQRCGQERFQQVDQRPSDGDAVNEGYKLI
jgi:hypothetical protein